MSIDQLTKDEFDKQFKCMITETENLITDYMVIYQQLLEFRGQYRKDYASNRIMHYMKDNILKYKIQEKRNIGFNYGKN